MTSTIPPTNGAVTTVPLDAEGVREGLRLERALALQHDLMHAAQNDLNRYVAHMAALHGVPPGWALTDWLRGFEPPKEQHDG